MSDDLRDLGHPNLSSAVNASGLDSIASAAAVAQASNPTDIEYVSSPQRNI
jgi:hypothetical protein